MDAFWLQLAEGAPAGTITRRETGAHRQEFPKQKTAQETELHARLGAAWPPSSPGASLEQTDHFAVALDSIKVQDKARPPSLPAWCPESPMYKSWTPYHASWTRPLLLTPRLESPKHTLGPGTSLVSEKRSQDPVTGLIFRNPPNPLGRA